MLSYVVGLSVVASGLTSMATGSRIVAENLRALFGLTQVAPLALALVYLALRALLVWRGLRESLWVNAVCTIVSVGDIAQLASATVLLLLAVFVLMNLAQLVLARRTGEPEPPIRLPAFVPLGGALICSVLLVVRGTTGGAVAPLLAAGLVVTILAAYVITRPAASAIAEPD